MSCLMLPSRLGCPDTRDHAHGENSPAAPPESRSLPNRNVLPSLVMTTMSLLKRERPEDRGLERPRSWTWDVFSADILSAAGASALVSPWVTAIDAIVVNKAATGSPLRSYLHRFLSNPKPPLGAILIPFLVYFGTYATANLFDSHHARQNSLDPATASATPSKFLATTTVSTALCVYKDGYFARLFGTAASRGPVPFLSYVLFTTRDAVTVFASFNMPAILAPKLSHLSTTGPVSFLFKSEETSLRTAQMLMPAIVQIVSTPIHLLGLDFAARQGAVPMRQRLSQIRKHAPFATPLRMARIIPAFGIGAVANTSFRASILAELV